MAASAPAGLLADFYEPDDAVAAARKVLAGTAEPGYRTPSMAFGADFILEVEGAVREDLPQSAS